MLRSQAVIGDRWGVRDDEIARHYACDDRVRDPALEVWRGVTVGTTPEHVWPWVTQIRLAPYSYDRLDNLGQRSPQELRGLPEPVVGERFTTALGRPRGRILAVTQGEELTAWIMGATLTYALVPEAATTRLLLKIVAPRGRVVAPLLALGDLAMARRQLLNLRDLAERTSSR